MKDQILAYLNMNDILDKYDIKHKGSQFCCPFHGIDKHPSAKAYEKSFYCFNCGKTGDLIQFVQYYFNLDFKEAMQKINQDFNLNINSDIKLDFNKIKEIEYKRKQKKRKLEALQKRFVELCDFKFQLEDKIEDLNSKIMLSNWEADMSDISKVQDKIGQLDMAIDDLIDEMSRLKNS